MNAPIEPLFEDTELPTKAWNAALDRFLIQGDCDVNTYWAMSLEQQGIIQELKKAFKRLKSQEE